MRFQQKLPRAGAANRLSHPKSRIQMLKKRNSTATDTSTNASPTGTDSDHNNGSLPNTDVSPENSCAVLLLSDCDSVLFHGNGSKRAERRGSKSGDSAFTGNMSNYAWSQEGMDDDLDLDFDDNGNNPTDYQADNVNDFVPWGAANDNINSNQNDAASKQSKDSLYLDDDDDEEGNALQATTSDGKTLAEAFARVTGGTSTVLDQGMDDTGNQEEVQSELELRIMAAQVLAAQAQIDSPLELPEKYKRKSARAKPGRSHHHHSSDSGSSLEEQEEIEVSPEEASQEEEEYVPHQPQEEESVEELFVEDDPVEAVTKELESHSSSQREEQRTASTGEESSSSMDEKQQEQQQQLQKQKRKEERRSRRSSAVDSQQQQLQKRKEERRNRRSSCRQSKAKALAAQIPKDVDDDHDTDTELMDQSSNTILSASSTTRLMDQSSSTILTAFSQQSSILGGASTGCDDSSHCSGTIPSTTKTTKQDRSSRRSSRRVRSSRGSELSTPKLPEGSGLSVPEQRTRDPPLTRIGGPQQPQRSSLFGRLYNGASHDSFAGSASAFSAKPKTELMMLLEKGSTERGRYGDEMEDNRSINTDDRSTTSKISIVKSISSAFSFGLSLGGGGRSHKKKNTKKKKETKKKRHQNDHGSPITPAATIHRSRRTKEDKPIAPPKTSGTKQRRNRRREAPPVEDSASIASC